MTDFEIAFPVPACEANGLEDGERLLCMLDVQNDIDRYTVLLRREESLFPVLQIPNHVSYTAATLLAHNPYSVTATVEKTADSTMCRLRLTPREL